MKKYISIFLLGLALVFIGCEKEDASAIDVDIEILKAMEDDQIPSVVACVVKDDGIAWEGTYGFANVSDGKLATRLTLYSLESISKLFLATTVMQLWERGQIDLNADINQYLPFDVRNPNFPDKKITSYMLLTHTSGLAWPDHPDRIPDFHHFYSAGDEPHIGEWLPEYILPEGNQYRGTVWKNFEPGTKELYSNIGTSLLALVVEGISGQDYRDYCRENIFEPLEMHNTGIRLSEVDEELLVTPYDDNNFSMQPFNLRHYPAGNIKCNIEDFSHFAIAFLNRGEFKGKKILEPSTVDKMFEVQNPSTGTGLLWGNCMGDCVGHSGGGTGFKSRAEWYLDSGEAIFIFSNKVNGSVTPGGRIYELVRFQCAKN